MATRRPLSDDRRELADAAMAPIRHDLYLAHQPTIERILRFVAGRHRCDADEKDDFAGWARLKLIDNDGAILRQFQGRGEMGSFLVVVIQRLFIDYRIAKWKGCRPSAEAKRLGPLAVRLEKMLVCDRLTFEEAWQALSAVDPELRRETLEDLRDRLPRRLPRRFEGERVLDSMPAPEPAPDDELIEKEETAGKRRATAAVMELMRELDPQDQIVLRLRFVEGMQIADIARTLHLPVRPLYRRIERLLGDLRKALAARGVRAEDLGWGTGAEPEPKPKPAPAGKSRPATVSERDDEGDE